MKFPVYNVTRYGKNYLAGMLVQHSDGHFYYKPSYKCKARKSILSECK